MRIWFDTEFIDDGKTIDLLSIGMVREDGLMYYAESEECDRSRAGDWVSRNVLPHLDGQVLPRSVIAHQIVEFAGQNPLFWAYFAAYDWVALCQLYGRMMDVPGHWPMFCLDLQQVVAERGVAKHKLPVHNGRHHDALDDAVWTMRAWEWVMANA